MVAFKLVVKVVAKPLSRLLKKKNTKTTTRTIKTTNTNQTNTVYCAKKNESLLIHGAINAATVLSY